MEELQLEGSHIQQIFQRDYRNIFFQIYHPGDSYVLRICLEQGRTRLHRVNGKPGSKGSQPRFSEFLRSRIKGARIATASQLGADRIIKLELERGEEQYHVYIKLWSNASNILCCQPDGVILDAAFRRPGRGESPGHMWVPPQQSDNIPEIEPRFTGENKSVQAQIAAHYAAIEREEARKTYTRELLRYYSMRETSLGSRLKRIDKAHKEVANATLLQKKGDALLAHLWQIRPGMQSIELEDYEQPGSQLTIELDAALTPHQNAERYFAEARKLRQRQEHLSQERDQIARRLEQTSSILASLQAGSLEIGELRDLHTSMREEAQSSRKGNAGEGPPGLEFESGGFRILVGRNARENDALLRRYTRGNDTWMHARDYPGGYVFIKTRPGKSIPLEVLLDAGNLALQYSKAKANGQADLYYTQVKYLRRTKTGKTGLVIPTQEKNLFVKADPQRLRRLLNAGGE